MQDSGKSTPRYLFTAGARARASWNALNSRTASAVRPSLR
jgi:hypothetical protein